MDTIKTIKTRRSIRKYTTEPISDHRIKEIIRCGMYAPSAGNEQPWHFLIIKNKEILKHIEQVHEHASMMKDAYNGILVCFDPSLEKHNNMAVQDCAAATQNMLLAIHDLGYGGCWIGVYPREHRMKGIRKLLNIPDNIIPFSLIAVGVANERIAEIDRFRENRIHYEQW